MLMRVGETSPLSFMLYHAIICPITEDWTKPACAAAWRPCDSASIGAGRWTHDAMMANQMRPRGCRTPGS